MRPSLLNPLFVPVDHFNGIGPKLSLWIQQLCGNRAIDVLWHFPNHVNHRPILQQKFQTAQIGTFQLTITEHKLPRTHKQPYIVLGNSKLGPVQLIFFNYHTSYLSKKLAIGETVWVSGHIVQEGDVVKVLHPDYIENDIHKIPEYESVYPLKAGVNGKVIRRLIEQIIPTLSDLPEEIPDTLLNQHHWPTWLQAIQAIHNPRTITDLDINSVAHQRLAFDELLANQLALHLIRRHNKKQQGQQFAHLNKLSIDLPFQLTNAQKTCLKQIRQDLSSPEKMVRLLQGDVGSGKTIVALLAALQVVENKAQVAFLAPTDILAHQHYETIKRFCSDLPINIQVLTAREKGKKRVQILSDLAQGKIDILIGTHAILEDNIIFHKLGLAVIDEQHRFGVKQRLTLAEKEKGVNLLVMTATPIPRTLALTTYGDMDVSLLNEKPANRQPINTCVIPISQTDKLIQHLINTDTQVYWVCPLVEESEESDLMAAEKRYKTLQKVFGSQVGLIHGKMKAIDKEKAMMDFISHKTKILVSTTVIEVGVDVPSAGLMIVEHAERFGLATLHQLRGRVGRGQEKAVCILLHGKLSDDARKRLAILRESEDGFKIAETDLQLRGAGEILGIRQSGIPLFRVANIEYHKDLLVLANQLAVDILNQDPNLQTNRGQALKNMLYLYEKDKELHLLKAG